MMNNVRMIMEKLNDIKMSSKENDENSAGNDLLQDFMLRKNKN
jgi:hypothetical protein